MLRSILVAVDTNGDGHIDFSGKVTTLFFVALRA